MDMKNIVKAQKWSLSKPLEKLAIGAALDANM